MLDFPNGWIGDAQGIMKNSDHSHSDLDISGGEMGGLMRKPRGSPTAEGTETSCRGTGSGEAIGPPPSLLSGRVIGGASRILALLRGVGGNSSGAS